MSPLASNTSKGLNNSPRGSTVAAVVASATVAMTPILQRQQQQQDQQRHSTINIATVDAAMLEMSFHQGNNSGGRNNNNNNKSKLERHKSIDRYSSIDSSDTFLSCNTHPFPSQGSLAGLEELAAKGSMAPNGSMPAVNISGVSCVYVNPFEPPPPPASASTPRRRLPLSAAGPSEASPLRRLKMSKRSRSSDTEDTWADALDHEDFAELTGEEPDTSKYRRNRNPQVII